MFTIAIVYLLIGHADYVIRLLNGKRNRISISIYRIMRNVGWVMLAAAMLNFFYESMIWNIAFVAIALMAIRIIQMSHRFLDHQKVPHEKI